MTSLSRLRFVSMSDIRGPVKNTHQLRYRLCRTVRDGEIEVTGKDE